MADTGSPERFEQLGAFYLGRLHGAEQPETNPELLLYDSKDLTTHAVCVGMTGSGKTGLCISLLEEAAIDGVPAIAIDPKGDLGNLMLTFPSLQAAEFRPWIDESEATRKGSTPEAYAGTVAARWREGLAQWGQDGRRIERLRAATDVAIYTPGSTAGLPLSVLNSFAAPPAALLDDADLFRERVSTAVSGLLALLGIEADPLRSREHILLASLFEHAWRAGKDLDIAALIQQVQAPPLAKIGVMDLDVFFPPKERFALSMTLNNILASPGFAAWMEGDPLDIKSLLWTPEGRPRISILSIAHLSEAERMFFVTILLNEVVGWMRAGSGTTSLRALLYMDEVFGYLPPVANPPSKRPMLTLLKQARAYGLGLVLATQNPVDLDYKGLSNTGTWFLGRLQTEQDKNRVLDGLEGAATSAGGRFDRRRFEAILSGLKSRVFLMNNVHEDEPVLFHTRWALSYLRGPLTRTQIRTLMAPRKQAAAAAPAPAAAAAPAGKATAAAAPKAAPARDGGPAGARPVLPPGVPECFVPSAAAGTSARLVYRPALLGTADLHFANARAGVDRWEKTSYLAPLDDTSMGNIWDGAEPLADPELELSAEPQQGISFAELPAPAARAKSYTSWQKSFKTHLYQQRKLSLWKCAALRLTSKVDESEADFRIRAREKAREKRDAQVEKLRKRYAPKLGRLQDRMKRAQEKLARETSQYGQQKMQTAISMGATVLGALFGRKVTSMGTLGRATTSMRGMGRTARERGDIGRAKENIEDLQEKFSDLEAEMEEALAQLKESVDLEQLEIKEVPIRPRKADISVQQFTLAWRPWRVTAGGGTEPA